MIDKIEIAIVNAASRALKIHEKASHLPTEDIIKKIMPFLERDEMSKGAKIAAIAAVNGVVKIKRHNPRLGDREVIEKFLKENKNLFEEFEES